MRIPLRQQINKLRRDLDRCRRALKQEELMRADFMAWSEHHTTATTKRALAPPPVTGSFAERFHYEKEGPNGPIRWMDQFSSDPGNKKIIHSIHTPIIFVPTKRKRRLKSHNHKSKR